MLPPLSSNILIFPFVPLSATVSFPMDPIPSPLPVARSHGVRRWSEAWWSSGPSWLAAGRSWVPWDQPWCQPALQLVPHTEQLCLWHKCVLVLKTNTVLSEICRASESWNLRPNVVVLKEKDIYVHVCIFILYTQVHSTHCMEVCAYKYICGSLIVPFPGVLDTCMFKMIRNELKCTVHFFFLLRESLEKNFVTGKLLFLSALILKQQVELFCKHSMHRPSGVSLFVNGKCVCSSTLLFRFSLF